MKNLLSFVMLALMTIPAMSQCNEFFPMRENVKVHYDHTDKKDKVTLKTTQMMKNVSGSGNSMRGIMVQEMIDVKKNEIITTSESDWICDNGTVSFHVNSMSHMEAAGAGNNMTVEVSGDKFDVPSTFKVGQALDDLTYTVKIMMGSMTMMNRTFTVADRKVEALESVTTPAGTFDCYKVTFLTSSSGGIGAGTTKSAVWYAKDIGLVKSELYSDNGKIMGKQILAKIEK